MEISHLLDEMRRLANQPIADVFGLLERLNPINRRLEEHCGSALYFDTSAHRESHRSLNFRFPDGSENFTLNRIAAWADDAPHDAFPIFVRPASDIADAVEVAIDDWRRSLGIASNDTSEECETAYSIIVRMRNSRSSWQEIANEIFAQTQTRKSPDAWRKYFKRLKETDKSGLTRTV